MLLIRFLSTRWSQTNPPPVHHNHRLKKKIDLFLCSSNLVNRAAKSQYIRGTMFFYIYAVIRSAHAKSISELCYLQIFNTTEINNVVCLAGRYTPRQTHQSTRSATTWKSLSSPTIPFTQGADTKWFCGFVSPHCAAANRQGHWLTDWNY